MEGNEGTPFGNTSFTINNQNLEEAEELIDRQRREEEIQNLLTHAMGEFDYDKTDSINASYVSLEDGNVNFPQQIEYEEQYRQAQGGEQLKILYEVRVREVTSLKNELQKLKEEFSEQMSKLKTKQVLLEIEVERKNISLQEVQNLLVEKVEKIKQVESELNVLKLTISAWEKQYADVNEEKVVLQNLNLDLQKQLGLMEKGFPLLNKTSDREFQESQKNKIVQLENTLDAALTQAERKERQHKELVQELKKTLYEKDNILAEKTLQISKLHENLDDVQRHCHELARKVEELQRAQKTNKENPLEEELRKIREHNEKADFISENVRKALSEEFQSQLSGVYSDNQTLRSTILKLENELAEAHQKIDTIVGTEAEKETLKIKLVQLKDEINNETTENGVLRNHLIEIEKNLSSAIYERDNLKQEMRNAESERKASKAENQNLREKLVLLENVNLENASLKTKLSQLETCLNEIRNPLTNEQSIQSSFAYIQHADFEILEREKEEINEKLKSATTYIEELENKVKLADQENSKLQVKIELELERENLIQCLQEKAAQFENIILERKKELSEVTDRVSVGVNTENVPDNEQEDGNCVLKMKYDALLFKTETKLRKELKREFDAKLDNLMSGYNEQFQKDLICKTCQNIKSENKKLEKLRTQDREVVKNLVSVWITKFEELQKHMQTTADNLRTVYERQLILLVSDLEQSYIEKYKKNKEHLEQKVEAELQQRKNEVAEQGILLHSEFNRALNRIATKIRKGEEKVLSVQKEYLGNVAAISKNVK